MLGLAEKLFSSQLGAFKPGGWRMAAQLDAGVTRLKTLIF